MFVESNIAGRQSKIERLCETIDKTFDVIGSKASTIALEEFGKYRYNKRLQESWSARFNQEKRVERTHSKLIAQESLNIKTLLLQLVEKADKSYLETDMKKRQANNEKARKDMEKMGTKMKNPAFEEVSNIRKGWGDAYASIYEKKLDPVGKEDSDIDNDGDVDSSDKYLAKRRKAIGKAMKEGVEEVEKEGYMPMTPERTARVEKAKKKAYNMDMRAQAKGDTKEADKQFKRRMAMDSGTKMRKEEVVNEAAGGIIAGTTALMKGATAAKAVKGASLLSKGASLAGGLGSLARGVGAGAGIGNKAAAALGAAGGFGLAKATEKKKQQQESVFSQAELDRIEEIVNSWED